MRRLALGGIFAVLVPLSVAHLAENALPVTYAGQVEQAVDLSQPVQLSAPTAKVNVAHADTYQFTNMRAGLTGPSGSVAGATIVFRVADVVVCTDTTNNNGEALCSSNEQFDRALFHPTDVDPLTYPYTATFAGYPPLAAATATGSLQKITGNGG
ncbi:MAG: hypothetical protein ACTHNS_10010 [Marmoricola sp.]